MAITRLGLNAVPTGVGGSFAGKTPAEPEDFIKGVMEGVMGDVMQPIMRSGYCIALGMLVQLAQRGA